MFQIIFQVVLVHKDILVIHSLLADQHQFNTRHKIYAIQVHVDWILFAELQMVRLFVLANQIWSVRHQIANQNVLYRLNVDYKKLAWIKNVLILASEHVALTPVSFIWINVSWEWLFLKQVT